MNDCVFMCIICEKKRQDINVFTTRMHVQIEHSFGCSAVLRVLTADYSIWRQQTSTRHWSKHHVGHGWDISVLNLQLRLMVYRHQSSQGPTYTCNHETIVQKLRESRTIEMVTFIYRRWSSSMVSTHHFGNSGKDSVTCSILGLHSIELPLKKTKYQNAIDSADNILSKYNWNCSLSNIRKVSQYA